MTVGVSYISKRYSKANNKCFKSYDPKHIKHLDVDNLYGYTTSKLFPTGGFKLIDPKEFDLNNYIKNILKVCVLKVDLEYPKELQELHNYQPLVLG